jgi:hypothetical protein
MSIINLLDDACNIEGSTSSLYHRINGANIKKKRYWLIDVFKNMLAIVFDIRLSVSRAGDDKQG